MRDLITVGEGTKRLDSCRVTYTQEKAAAAAEGDGKEQARRTTRRRASERANERIRESVGAQALFLPIRRRIKKKKKNDKKKRSKRTERERPDPQQAMQLRRDSAGEIHYTRFWDGSQTTTHNLQFRVLQKNPDRRKGSPISDPCHCVS